MTRPELRAACAAFTVTAPVTVADCREIFAELRPRVPVGIPLDVACVPERVDGVMQWNAIRVTVGTGGSTYSVELQAKS